MKVLLLGSTGLLGSAIREVLTEDSLIDLDCPPRSTLALGKGQEFKDYILNKPCDVIINCAARVGGLYSQIRSPATYLSDNIAVVNDLYSSTSKLPSKPHIINFASTCIFPVDIQYPIEPSKLHLGPPHDTNGSYSYAKRMVDIYAKAYSVEYNINSTTFILGNLFGPHDHFSSPNDAHVIPSLIVKAFKSVSDKSYTLSIMGDGSPLREFLFSYDAANLVRNYLGSGIIFNDRPDRTYLFSNHDAISIYELSQLIVRLVWPSTPIGIRRSSTKDKGQHKKPSRTSDYINSILPQLTPIDVALVHTIEWYRNNYLKTGSTEGV
jgi:GDP-L-fucose synthase